VRTALDVFLLVDGLSLIAASRILADTMRIPGADSPALRVLGLGDDPASATYRYVTSVLSGLVLAGAAVVDLAA
jgi:hypothetical protein